MCIERNLRLGQCFTISSRKLKSIDNLMWRIRQVKLGNTGIFHFLILSEKGDKYKNFVLQSACRGISKEAEITITVAFTKLIKFWNSVEWIPIPLPTFMYIAFNSSRTGHPLRRAARHRDSGNLTEAKCRVLSEGKSAVENKFTIDFLNLRTTRVLQLKTEQGKFHLKDKSM
jgi:hypothetical protein